MPLIFIRVALAGLMLLPLMWVQGGMRIWRENWLRIAIVGSLITAIPFCMLSWATLSLSGGRDLGIECDHAADGGAVGDSADW